MHHRAESPWGAARAWRAPLVTDRVVAVALLAILALVAVWSAAVGTAPGDVALVPCTIDALTGAPCPGCGMTRACVALARGEVREAWGFHPLAFALMPLVLLYALWPDRVRRSWRRIGGPGRGLLLAVAFASVMLNWLPGLV